MRLRSVLPILALAIPLTLHAQGTAADTAKWKADSADYVVIQRDKTAPKYSKDAQRRLWVRDSLFHLKTVTPPPVPVDTNAPATVEIHFTAQSVNVGATMQASAVVKNKSGRILSTPVAWTSVTPAVATVSGTGLITGVSAGTATIRARADTASTTRTLAVVGGQPPPDTGGGVPPIPPDTTSGSSIAARPQNVPVAQYPSCAAVVTVSATDNLQTAINNAAGGTCLQLAAGATYVGNFVLPNRATQGFVTITTQGYTNQPGVRMTPTKARLLAKILSASYTEAIGTNPGAHGYIFRGVEVGATGAQQTTGGMNMLVRLTDQVQGTNPPRDIQFQQTYVHGTPTMELRRTFRGDGQYLVLIDSWVDDAHSNNSDSQAWLGLNCAQYQLIQNNTLRAGHEIVMFGGGDPSSQACQPHDIVVRQNHIYHPPSWYKVWQVKNCIETKNVVRYLIEGNVVENCWPDAQAGFGFVLKSENQDGTAAYTTTSDVTIQYNQIIGASSVFNLSGKGSSSNPNVTSARYDIHDNVCTNVQPSQWSGGQGIVVQLLSQITDVQFKNNTCYNDARSLGSASLDGGGGAAAIRLVVQNSAMHSGQYGWKCSGGSSGKPSLDMCAAGYVWQNVMVVGAGNCSGYPATTTCPASFPALPTASIGADTAKVNLFTKGVVVTDPLVAAVRRYPRASYKVPWKESPEACRVVGKQIPASCDRGVQ